MVDEKESKEIELPTTLEDALDLLEDLQERIIKLEDVFNG